MIVRNVLSSLFAFVLIFGFMSVTNASAVNFVSTINAQISFNGVEYQVEGDSCLSECDEELTAEGKANVLAQNADLGTGFSLGIDAGSDFNYGQADPASGIDATLTIHLRAHIDFFGERYEAHESMILVSEGTIASYPPTDDMTYVLENSVTFSGPCGDFVLHAGATVSMSPQ